MSCYIFYYSVGYSRRVSGKNPFGETRLESQSGNYDSTQKFTGHELDDSTNLYYAKARYYDPLIGRFISQDPLQVRPAELMEKAADEPQVLNYYSYVSNNPLILIDPSGELRIKAGDASDDQIKQFNDSLAHLVTDVKASDEIQGYYQELYDVDILDLLTNDKRGPVVTMYSDRYENLAPHLVPVAQYFGDGVPWNDGIEFYSTAYDFNIVGMSLIHEIEHWANDKATWFGNLNPDLSEFLSQEQIDLAEDKSQNGGWGGGHPAYGYSSEIVLYGDLIDQYSRDTY